MGVEGYTPGETYTQEELEFKGEYNYERLLGRAVLEGEITCLEALQALENYNGTNEREI